MLTITPSASKQLQRLLAKEPGKALRVFVSPGGCSGMQYGMTLDDQEQDGDQYVEAGGRFAAPPLAVVASWLRDAAPDGFSGNQRPEMDRNMAMSGVVHVLRSH